MVWIIPAFLQEPRPVSRHEGSTRPIARFLPNQLIYSSKLKKNFLSFLSGIFAPLHLRRRDGRAVECGGLENR